MRNNNFEMIQQMFKVLEDEESQDNQLRATYREKWSRMPSNALNMNFKQQLGEF